MRCFKAVILLVFGIILSAFKIEAQDVTQQFQDHEIVPDILDKSPSDLIKISYNGKGFQVGDKLTPTETKDKPDIEWNFDKDKFYALIMIDPDAPSRQDKSWGEFLHWTFVNIPGDDFTKGETLAEYMPCGPPQGTDYHRYTFIMYQQPEKLHFDEPTIGRMSIEGRPKFSLRKFAQKYNFGDPVAGNMFLAEFDDFVPGFHLEAGIEI